MLSRATGNRRRQGPDRRLAFGLGDTRDSLVGGKGEVHVPGRSQEQPKKPMAQGPAVSRASTPPRHINFPEANQ